ncbi:MAG: hypothetical protein KAW67_08405, partial [Candidatus Eisenbacteria sp.]|nr:hypothetical protein [Candidatus Eisenbacteria bacterium]
QAPSWTTLPRTVWTMREKNSTSPRDSGRALWTSGTAVTAIFVALAAALGFLLLSVPNVELVTFTVFASGVVLGRWRGALVGALAMAIYSGANPYGSGLGVPTMLAAQLAASAFAGLMGGIAAPLWRRRAAEGAPGQGWRPGAPVVGLAGRGHRALPLVAGGLGLAVTAVYQAAVIVGLAVMSPEFRTGALAVLLSNAFFGSVHLVSNTIVFAVLAPAVLPRLVRLAGPRPTDAGARTPSAPGTYGGNE